MENVLVIRGMFAHSTEQDPLVIYPDHVIGVANGKVGSHILKSRLKHMRSTILCSCFRWQVNSEI